MDSWVTDGFYSHFPSYSQQPTRREALAKARQLEYQTFLSRVSPRKGKSDGKAQKRHTTNESQSKRQKIPTNEKRNEKLPKLDTNKTDDNNGESDMSSSRVEVKNRFLDELENMNLPDIFNEQLINERNQKMKEEKRMKNIKYQQELMQQIEQKRREREIQRAKEEEEEERLTKRMEEQLKSVRLHDEFESQRQTRHREKSRINIDSNRPIVAQQPTKPPTTVRSEPLEPNVHTYRSYDERKAQTDRGKENWEEPKRNDKEIYNFFTNSAHNQLKDIRFSHYFDLEDLSENEVLPNSMSSSTYNTYPSKSIRHQDAIQKRQNNSITKQPMCNFCKHNRFLARNQEDNMANGLICGSCENEPICLNCRKEICFRCKRPTHNDEHALKVPPRHLKQRNTDTEFIVMKNPEPRTKPKYVRLDSFQPIFTDEDDSLSDISSTDPKPYSFNINESSVFHPNKSRLNRKLSVSIRNGEVFVQPESTFDELKRITEEKLQKYAKNYGDFRYKRPTEGKEVRGLDTRMPVQITNPKSKLNLDPLPVMRDNTKKLIEFAKELERGDNNIFKRIEAKHQIPAVQTNSVVQNNDATSTLTQVGSFKKQLLLDKLNF